MRIEYGGVERGKAFRSWETTGVLRRSLEFVVNDFPTVVCRCRAGLLLGNTLPMGTLESAIHYRPNSYEKLAKDHSSNRYLTKQCIRHQSLLCVGDPVQDHDRLSLDLSQGHLASLN
jgi:hypothetical protein